MVAISTWINVYDKPNSTIQVTGLSDPIRLDRDSQVLGKKRGGGVCVYINEKWSGNYKLGASHCPENIELLSLSFRPFYLRREFGQVFVTVVDVQSLANIKTAAGLIYDTMAKLENIAPDAPKL